MRLGCRLTAVSPGFPHRDAQAGRPRLGSARRLVMLDDLALTIVWAGAKAHVKIKKKKKEKEKKKRFKPET